MARDEIKLIWNNHGTDLTMTVDFAATMQRLLFGLQRHAVKEDLWHVYRGLNEPPMPFFFSSLAGLKAQTVFYDRLYLTASGLKLVGARPVTKAELIEVLNGFSKAIAGCVDN